MKRILQNTCMLAAFMILCVFLFSIIWVGVTSEIILVLQLFVLSFIISVVNYIIDEVTTLPILGNYMIKYLGVTVIVMLYGFIVGWFYKSNFWMAFVYVAVVFVLAYMLDTIKVKKDIEFINSRIRGRE